MSRKKQMHISRTFWIYLHSYVYVSVKKNDALVYNTLNGKILEYTNNNKIADLIKRLNVDKNLYVLKIKEEDINEEISEFIDSIRRFFMGDILDTSLRPHKPVQLKPLLNLQKTFDYRSTMGALTNIMVNEEVHDYIDTIRLYINDACGNDCRICRDAYKQFSCCHKVKGKLEITLSEIKQLIKHLEASNVYKYCIYGGDISIHSQFSEIVIFLNSVVQMKEYGFHYLNISHVSNELRLLAEGNNHLSILVHFPLQENDFKECLKKLDTYQIPTQYRFIVEKEEDIESVETLVSKYGLTDIDLIPYYSGMNRNFFEDQVYINRQTIEEGQFSLKTIFGRMTFNAHNFKKMTILSNRRVYANVNHSSLGILGRNNIYDLVHREMHGGKSWLKLRKHVMPCKSCIFCNICPPISNYEYVLGRYNLCDIKNNLKTSLS